MPITLSSIPSSNDPRAPSSLASEGSSRGVANGAKAGSPPTNTTPSAENPASATEKITLTAASSDVARAYDAATPYAEVWKNGRKVAAIDSHGDVRGLDGFVTPVAGGGTGIGLAIQRAALIAMTVGGEIRVAGRVTDVSTLTMSARLREAYGR